MECTWPTSQINVQEKVKEQLIRGHELANQLRLVVSNGDGGSARGLTKEIFCSFTTILSLLSGNHDSKGKNTQVNIGSRTIALPTVVDSSSSWVDALETIKSKESSMDNRSSSKKRKASHSWSRDAPDFIDDGHAWRKYGQKQILDARHPRSYFRCSRKYDQRCKAIKKVQKVEDDPSLFRTTYIGNHTCKHSLLKAPELVLDNVTGGSYGEESTSNSRFTITFGSTSIPYQKEHPFFSSDYSLTEREIIKSNHVPSSQLSPSLSFEFNYLAPPDQLMEKEHPFFSSDYSLTEIEIIKSNHVPSSQLSPSLSFEFNYLAPPDQLMVFESSTEPIGGLPKVMELHSEDMTHHNAMMEYFEQESLPI